MLSESHGFSQNTQSTTFEFDPDVQFSPLEALDALLDDSYPHFVELYEQVGTIITKLQLDPDAIEFRDVSDTGMSCMRYTQDLQTLAMRVARSTNPASCDSATLIALKTVITESILAVTIHNNLLTALAATVKGEFPSIVDGHLQTAAVAVDDLFDIGSELASDIRSLLKCS